MYEPAKGSCASPSALRPASALVRFLDITIVNHAITCGTMTCIALASRRLSEPGCCEEQAFGVFNNDPSTKFEQGFYKPLNVAAGSAQFQDTLALSNCF